MGEKKEAGREKKQCERRMEQRCYSVPEQPPTLTPTPPLQRPAQRQNPHLHMGSADLRRDEEPDLQKHQSALQPDQISLSLSPCLSVNTVSPREDSQTCFLLSERRRLLSELESTTRGSQAAFPQRCSNSQDASSKRSGSAWVNSSTSAGEKKKRKVLQLDRLKHT